MKLTLFASILLSIYPTDVSCPLKLMSYALKRVSLYI